MWNVRCGHGSTLPSPKRPRLEDAVALEPLRVAGDRVARRPEGVGVSVGVALRGRLRILPPGPALATDVEHVVVVRVPAHPHRDQLDQGRTASVSRALRRPREAAGDRFRVGAVEGDSRNAVARRLVGEDPDGRLVGDRRRERGLVVLHAEDRRSARGGAEVDRLVPLTERGAALADEGQCDSGLAPAAEGQRHAGGRQRGDGERRRRRQDAARHVADVEVLAVHRRAGLAHLCAQYIIFAISAGCFSVHDVADLDNIFFLQPAVSHQFAKGIFRILQPEISSPCNICFRVAKPPHPCSPRWILQSEKNPF